MNAETTAPAAAETTASNPPSLVPNLDGTVTDTRTGLIWTRDDVTEKPVPFDQAMQACADCRVGGFDDWRAPTVEELFLLADRTRHHPAIDQAAFPSCAGGWYWSNTVDAASPADCAWVVSFGSGVANVDNRDYGLRVRAVRGPSRQ